MPNVRSTTPSSTSRFLLFPCPNVPRALLGRIRPRHAHPCRRCRVRILRHMSNRRRSVDVVRRSFRFSQRLTQSTGPSIRWGGGPGPSQSRTRCGRRSWCVGVSGCWTSSLHLVTACYRCCRQALLLRTGGSISPTTVGQQGGWAVEVRVKVAWSENRRMVAWQLHGRSSVRSWVSSAWVSGTKQAKRNVQAKTRLSFLVISSSCHQHRLQWHHDDGRLPACSAPLLDPAH